MPMLNRKFLLSLSLFMALLSAKVHLNNPNYDIVFVSCAYRPLIQKSCDIDYRQKIYS